MEEIFKVAELHFKNFPGQGNVQSIDKDALVDEIKEKEQYVIAYFDECVSSAELDIRKNIANDILQQALILYIKVRSFTHAKDVINKYKAMMKSSKSKSLRTELKRSHEQRIEL